MVIRREIQSKIEQDFNRKKAVIIYGARRVGKTTLLNELATQVKEPLIWLDGDESDVRKRLNDATSTKLKRLIGSNKFVFIDEAQRIENIGLTIKLFVDNIPDVQVVATGSSSFELLDKIKEPLTGRKYEHILFPFSYSELTTHLGTLEARRILDLNLQYGCYPEIVNDFYEAERNLKLIADSYLYKDVFAYEGLKRPDILVKISEALALQVGSEVSYNELAQLVGADKKTVMKYIFLLEQAFVIFRLPSISRNKRSEIKRGKKIYFWDVGIRNALISNFYQIEFRTDKGAVWENYFIAERLKFLRNKYLDAKTYFWRNVNQREVDFVEEYNNKTTAYEIKWNPKSKAAIPKPFRDSYPDAETNIINNVNFEDFLV